MTEHQDQLHAYEVDWPRHLPFVHIFRSFRMAIHPRMLLLSLLLVVFLMLLGMLLDALIGPTVFPGEVLQFSEHPSTESFDVWRRDQPQQLAQQLERRMASIPVEFAPETNDDLATRLDLARSAIEKDYPASAPRDERTTQWQVRNARLRQIQDIYPQGPFAATLADKLEILGRLTTATISGRLGAGQWLGGEKVQSSTVLGCLRDLSLLPWWLWHAHMTFLLLWSVGALLLWSWLGGTIGRVAAVNVTRPDEVITASAAHAFVRQRWVWFFLAPLIPLIGVALLWLAMLVGGLLFNVIVLNIGGAILFFLALGGGFIAATVLVVLAAGSNLLFPAICVEGSEAFDAIARASNYVIGKTWRMIFYNAVAAVYGAATCLFVTFVIYVALVLTQTFVGASGLASAAHGEVGVFEAMFTVPQFPTFTYQIQWSALGLTGRVSAAVIKGWVFLFSLLPAAYAISYYFMASTWIYLLLRRDQDGAEFDDVYLDQIGGAIGTDGADAAEG